MPKGLDNLENGHTIKTDLVTWIKERMWKMEAKSGRRFELT
jgi:hypothetical protein